MMKAIGDSLSSFFLLLHCFFVQLSESFVSFFLFLLFLCLVLLDLFNLKNLGLNLFLLQLILFNLPLVEALS